MDPLPPDGGDRDRRDRLEHELRTTADSFRALAEGSDLGMYRFSFVPALRVDYVNPHLEELIGVRFVELSRDPRPLWERLDPATRDGLDAARRGADVDWPLHGRWRHPDGRVLDLEFREAPMRDVDGRLEAVFGMVRDVTDQLRQERALASALDLERAAADRLRRVDELRKVFLQAVSHELRTPLTALLGFSATLQDRADALPPDRLVAMAERIHHQSCKMERLLDDLLDVDRLSRRYRVDARGRVRRAPPRSSIGRGERPRRCPVRHRTSPWLTRPTTRRGPAVTVIDEEKRRDLQHLERHLER